jgi:hypothetical protein
MKSKVTDTDRGFKKRFAAYATLAIPRTVAVGILEAEGAAQSEDGALTVLQVAIINELGLGVPARSFIRAWFDQNRPKCVKFIFRTLAQAAEGKFTIDQAYDRIGLRFAGQIQKFIADGVEPANSLETVRQKRGSTKPLINTGQMRSSIRHKVR